jgi:hypothetical protein
MFGPSLGAKPLKIMKLEAFLLFIAMHLVFLTYM